MRDVFPRRIKRHGNRILLTLLRVSLFYALTDNSSIYDVNAFDDCNSEVFLGEGLHC
jgi:hypothetical protein